MNKPYHFFSGLGKVVKAQLTEWYMEVHMRINDDKILEFRFLEDLDRVEKACKQGALIHFSDAQLHLDYAVIEKWETKEDWDKSIEEILKKNEAREKGE
jgi:hypothetical protein